MVGIFVYIIDLPVRERQKRDFSSQRTAVNINLFRASDVGQSRISDETVPANVSSLVQAFNSGDYNTSIGARQMGFLTITASSVKIPRRSGTGALISALSVSPAINTGAMSAKIAVGSGVGSLAKSKAKCGYPM